MAEDLLEKISADSGAELERNIALAPYTTLRVGGRARAVLTCRTTESLISCVRVLDAAEEPALILAGGSNLLVADGDLDFVVVRVATSAVRVSPVDSATSVIHADAGAVWEDVVAQTVAAGLGGLECLSGIPGSAGATPVQNVGAYGVEVASLLRRVLLLDRGTGQVRWVEPAALGLGYRTSILKHRTNFVVLAVELLATTDGYSAPLRYRELAEMLGADLGTRRPAGEVREAVLALRRGKGMVLEPADHDTWSAGSFFTNPVVDDALLSLVRARVAERLGLDAPIPTYASDGGTKLSAAWLIERAGFAKGYPGPGAPARLSTKHTLALTNRGWASAADIIALAREIRAKVESAFGVRLEPEPVCIRCEI